MGINSRFKIGKKSALSRLKSNENKVYYRIYNTSIVATVTIISTNNNNAEFRVIGNTIIDLLNLEFIASDPNNVQLTITFGDAIERDSGIVPSPGSIERFFLKKSIATNKLEYGIAGFGGADLIAKRDLIIGLDPNRIVSIPNFYGADIQKI